MVGNNSSSSRSRSSSMQHHHQRQRLQQMASFGRCRCQCLCSRQRLSWCVCLHAKLRLPTSISFCQNVHACRTGLYAMPPSRIEQVRHGRTGFLARFHVCVFVCPSLFVCVRNVNKLELVRNICVRCACALRVENHGRGQAQS